MKNSTKYQGGCWPTPQQEQLLQAALSQGPRGLGAWQEWKSQVEMDDVDYGSQRLFPLLYQNLVRQDVHDPMMERLKSVYRKTWFENQVLYHRMGAVLQSFHQLGIETVILKGAALAPLYYKDRGLRPMLDFDILVHPKDVPHAIELLGRLGWHNSKLDRAPLDLVIRFGHALEFFDRNKQQLDLHWHVLREACWPGADDAFWAASEPMDLDGVPTRRLSPTDELLHTAVHGVSWNVVPPFRWVADAVMILNSSAAEIDWNRLVTQAEGRRLTLPLRAALSYLSRSQDAPIPPAVLAELNRYSPGRLERIEYRVQTGPDVETIGWLPRLLFWYVRLARDASWWQKIGGFPLFLQSFLELPHPWQLPLGLLRSASGPATRIGRVVWLSLGELTHHTR